MRSIIRSYITETLWVKKTLLSALLLPFSWLYQLIIYCRFYYIVTLKKRPRPFKAPVIIVGNLTVGGVGKTPLVAYIVNQLRQHGYQPGIVSRGYGGKATSWPQIVSPSSDPSLVGDEPLLLVQQTGCPMVVGPDRVAAVNCLLSHFSCDVIVCDDGLQHYALWRDIEVSVVNGMRRFGNQRCLPAGPLREPLSRLARIPHQVCNGGEALEGEIMMQIIPGQIYQINDPGTLLMPQQLKQKVVHALCGIGHPQRFFNMLRAIGYHVIEHAFPDHYQFRASDIDLGDNAMIIMTEKDAVKCLSFVDHRHYCLPIEAQCADLMPHLLADLSAHGGFTMPSA